MAEYHPTLIYIFEPSISLDPPSAPTIHIPNAIEVQSHSISSNHVFTGAAADHNP
jgi:hypothetical protein